jgi:hypothetical protein
MTPYTVFDAATGRIKRCGGCSDASHVALQPQEGEAVIAGQDARGDTHHVVGGQIVERPAFPVPEALLIAVGDSTTYALPPETAVSLNGATTTLEDGALVIEADYPGRYELCFVRWPYRDHTLTVTIT